MESLRLGSGDTLVEVIKNTSNAETCKQNGELLKFGIDGDINDDSDGEEVLSKFDMVHDDEETITEHIAQCKSLIESIKSDINDEKTKLKTEKIDLPYAEYTDSKTSFPEFPLSSNGSGNEIDDYFANVEDRPNCDKTLIDYRKQLEVYQNTLSMARLAKKNSVRRKLLAKAYKLKLLEIENECNIEMLRIKQNLLCLKPLQMIVNKWKNCRDNDDSDSCKNNCDYIDSEPSCSEILTDDSEDNFCKSLMRIDEELIKLKLTFFGNTKNQES